MSHGLGHVGNYILFLLKRRSRMTVSDITGNEWVPRTRGRYVSALRAMRDIARKFPQDYVVTGGQGRAPLVLCTRRYFDKHLAPSD